MNWEQPEVYAVHHKDESVRAVSRSGGIFTALSDKILEKGGVIYGCILSEDFNAIHIRADGAEIRNKMRGSKYIQSKLGDTFNYVKQDLDNGRIVLFSGTGCQIDGLKRFLKKQYDLLICVDIVCHGVPSKKVWQKYIEWQEHKKRSKVLNVEFRNKRDFGWTAHVETLWLENGSVLNSETFKNLFYGHTILRPSCYECPYKSIHREGDISIADYWRIEKAAPKFADDKGTSLVLVNSNAGKILFDSVKDDILWQKTRLEDSMQLPLKQPFPRPQNRNQFWEDFQKKPFVYVAKKYGNYGFGNKVKAFFRKIESKVRRMIK